MKNADIVSLVDNGILSISSHEQSAAQAYKVCKFRSAIERALKGIGEAEKNLLKEAEIEDIDKLLKERAALTSKERDENEEKKYTEDNDKLNRYLAMRGKLLDEEAVLTEMKKLPYADWKKLQDENRAVKIGDKAVDVLSGRVENLLEGIFWEAPEEEE